MVAGLGGQTRGIRRARAAVVGTRSGEEVSIDAEEVPPLVLKFCEVVEPFGCLVFRDASAPGHECGDERDDVVAEGRGVVRRVEYRDDPDFSDLESGRAEAGRERARKVGVWQVLVPRGRDSSGAATIRGFPDKRALRVDQ